MEEIQENGKKDFKETLYDYEVIMDDGTRVCIETKEKDLSIYDQMRLARLKLYHDSMEKTE